MVKLCQAGSLSAKLPTTEHPHCSSSILHRLTSPTIRPGAINRAAIAALAFSASELVIRSRTKLVCDQERIRCRDFVGRRWSPLGNLASNELDGL